jgi:hypothetical protein
MRMLVNDVFKSFNLVIESQEYITYPSIPVIYFGDYSQYQISYPKVITVGLNPPNNEFPSSSPFDRFLMANEIDTLNPFSGNDFSLYISSLNNYFKNSPNNWFDSFDPILNGLNTSYYPNMVGNNALHTNFCSPFATDVTWSKLKSSTQFTLCREGRDFWHKLIEILEPDLIIFSIPKKYLERVSFKKTGWKIFTSITRKKDGSLRSKPYAVEYTESKIGNKRGYFVFGKAAQLPFGTLSTDIKIRLGEELNNLLPKNPGY